MLKQANSASKPNIPLGGTPQKMNQVQNKENFPRNKSFSGQGAKKSPIDNLQGYWQSK